MTTLELHATNVTPAQFLGYIRAMAKKKNIQLDVLSTKEFANLEDTSMGSLIEGHDEYDFWYTKPYEYQTCFKHKDGTTFNEICEFTFDDDKRGHGYYYLLDKSKE